ncbi:hypothetical protein M1B72_14585 [Geomonas paludis]|uniref:Uncharacterized protein n=1 Tax=Geomonas paludis TaxID=2740185 RepID=A0ABY4LA31_9BACT|nr:hypothetical protein [Geomonas paludis]UPU34669.1 hypothetical protein M1B72_14585 [Geomonas paludis]
MDDSGLLELVEELACKVGFGKLEALDRLGDSEPDHYLSSSSYAKILLLRANGEDEETLQREIRSAQDRLDSLLADEERRQGVVIDGYLLVSLQAPPAPTMLSMIREYELDTHLCRKHIFWPEGGATASMQWRRLLRSTVLALPDSTNSATQIAWPEFEKDYNEIWRQISRSGSSAAAARKFLRGDD